MITSRASRLVLSARMPWSIASCTSSRPITGPAAPRIAITASSATRPRWPRRYIPSRDSPVLRCNELVSDESCEPAVTREQLGRRAVLDDAAVEQDDRAVHARGVAGGQDLVPGHVRIAGNEVLAQWDGEEDRPLGHDRDRRAQLRDLDLARVDAAEQHAAARRVVEARQQVEQRRLADAGR